MEICKCGHERNQHGTGVETCFVYECDGCTEFTSDTPEVITPPVRMNYCMDCPHKAFEHEIAMNTPQTGRCLVEGCDCLALNSPSREELGDEVERLTSRLSKAVEALEELRRYAERMIAADDYGSPTHVLAATSEALKEIETR